MSNYPMKLFIFILLFSTYRSQAQNQLSAKEWRTDLEYMDKMLRLRHANPFHAISEAEYKQSLEKLHNDIQSLDDYKILIRMSALVASIQDAHTYIDVRGQEKFPVQVYPFKGEWFEDGIYIIEADAQHKDLLGRKILIINGTPIEQVIEKVRKIGYRENEYTERLSVPRFMIIPEVLRALGIASDTKSLQLILEKDGTQQVEQLQVIPKSDIQWVSLLETDKLPLYSKDKDNIYWSQWQAEDDLFYVQFNSCHNKDDLSFAEFANQIQHNISEKQPKKVVLDLRWNVGGNSAMTYSILYPLWHHVKQNSENQVFVIIGRWTLSATVVMCNQIKKMIPEAIFVGEPTGAAPNLYGENGYPFTLPHSQISVQYSTDYYQSAGPEVDAPWIAPHLHVPLFFKEYEHYVDPAMEVINQFQALPNVDELVKPAALKGDMKQTLENYQVFVENPTYKYLPTERAIRKIADQVLEQGRFEDAMQLYNLNLEKYGDKAIVSIISIGLAYLEQGDKSKVREYLKKGQRLLETVDYDADDNLYNAYRYRLQDFVAKKLEELEK